MKILIAGGGIGGLYAAYLFGKGGHAVTVYERAANVDEMRYDWHDDVNPSVFERLGLKIPKESFPKGDWTFVSPSGNVLCMEQSEELIDMSIERRPLNRYLYGLASEVADVEFGAEAVGAVYDGKKVTGLKISVGKEVREETCDLVIDSCGVLSAVRRSLNEETGIMREVPSEETFIAYRAFYDAVPEAKIDYGNKVYMKHLGQAGISWCIMDNDPSRVNVLVGRIGELSESGLNIALEALRGDNPVLGKRVLRGGQVCVIPVRRPLSVFVADGYAAIGDAACMTVPLIGSGIATSLIAAKLLYEAAGKDNKSDINTLWNYEVACFKEFGAQHCGVDYMKCWLLKCKTEDIDWIFGSGILSNDDLQGASVGKLVTLTPSQMLKKLVIGIGKLPLLLKMGLMLNKAQRITAAAEKIPATYDDAAVKKWAAKCDAFFG